MTKTIKKLSEPLRQTVRKKRVMREVNVSKLAKGLESLRNGSGAFKAANSDEYNACWIRDQLYANLAYYYMGDIKKFQEGLWVVFDILHKNKTKIERVICYPPRFTHEYIHAKFNADTFDEITDDWGHHQIDAIGLFLFTVSFARDKGINVFRNGEDVDLMQIMVAYLTAVRYWEAPDNGMWEESMELHASSIGACVAGLTGLKKHGLAVVTKTLIQEGMLALYRILPNESPTRESDLAQLSLIWPYRVVSSDVAEVILMRVEERLLKKNGLNRYEGDQYFKSEDGSPAEWTMGFFWLAIIYREMGDDKSAKKWLERGLNTITKDGHLPELYTDNKPNGNTPLAWSHSLAIISLTKLMK